MASVVLKIKFCENLYRLRLSPGEARAFSYAQLQTSACKLTGLPESATATFTYLDREGDVVTLSKDADVTEALVSQGLNPLRITMLTQGTSGGDSPNARQNPEQSQAQKSATRGADDTHRKSKCDHNDVGKVVHFGFRCNECQTNPIQGPRYRSCVLPDYDLCSACYKKRSSDGKAFVHDMYSCDGCGMCPIRGSLFMSVKYRNYHLCLACFNAQHEIDQGQFAEMNEGFHRVVSPTLDIQSLTRVLSIRNTGRALEVVHSGVSCSECRTDPIVGPRYKSYESLDDDLCLRCYERSGNSSTLHIHRASMCDGCSVVPIIGHLYQSMRDSNYVLCGKCFAPRGKAEQAGYMESSRGFYRLVHPDWVVNSGRTTQGESTRSRNYAQSAPETNVNYARLVYPELDLQSLTSAVNIRNLGGALQVFHFGVSCNECRMNPIQGPRFKSYERLDYDLCLGCYERCGRDETLHTHALFCSGCYTTPILGRLYHSWRNLVWNYRLCGKCFVGLSQHEQAGYVEVHQGFYTLVHPALVPALVANTIEGGTNREGRYQLGYMSQSSYQGQSQSGGHKFSNWVDIATTAAGIIPGIISNLNLS